MEINLKSLNPEQKKAVTHTDGPLLIVAGAGTGKTTAIAQRINYLIEKKLAKPEEVLALTFTEKAAAEMEERVDQLLPYGYVDLWISTFHAFAEKILKQHALEIGVPNDFKLLNQTQQWMLVRQNLEKFNLDYYRPLGNPTKFIHALIKLFSRAKDEAITPEQYLEYAKDFESKSGSQGFIKSVISAEEIKSLSAKDKKELLVQEIKKTQEVAAAYSVYQQLLLEHNALDFGDLINYCLVLFKKRPAVLAKYRKQFKYVLVDEFQDTNHAQYELVKLLSEPNNNITVVGDDDQAIYKFRGASVSNILEFKKDYPKAEEIFLTQNYRSSQSILDLSYEFIKQNNPNRLEVKLSKGKNKKLSKKLKAATKDKGTIEHLSYEAADDEIRGVIEKIVELKKKQKDSAWSDFAILSRTNDTANSFAQVLRKTEIPYRFMASRGLYNQDIVQDIIAYLRLLDDYHESAAVYRILNSPVIGIGHRELVNFNYWARRTGHSLFRTLHKADALNQSKPETQQTIRKFLEMTERHSQAAKSKSASEVIINFLQDSGYLDYITKLDPANQLEISSYLDQFYKKIVSFEDSTTNSSVKSFLGLIDLEIEAGESGNLSQNFDEGPDAVKIMTVHAAKGLEFKNVFVVNMVDRKFPTDNRPDPILLPEKLIKEILPEGDVHTQEERRLFYVAMTRAKSNLYFTTAKDYGGTRKKKVSKFLVELEVLGFKLQDSEDFSLDEGEVTRPRLQNESRIQIENQELKALIPKKFSFTQLKMFERNPYEYWINYILKIPQQGKDIFSFGTSIHSTLQQFFLLVRQRKDIRQQDLFAKKDLEPLPEGQAPVSLEELLNLYQRYWVDDWYKDRKRHDEYFERGKNALKEFYKAYQKELPVPKHLEQPFTLKVHDKDNGEVYSIMGKIDRVDQFEDGIEIIDYKTGKGKTEKTLTRDDKDQLLIYQLAAQQQLKEKVTKLTFYYLETGDRVSFVGKEKDLETLEKKIIKIINNIKNLELPLDPKDYPKIWG